MIHVEKEVIIKRPIDAVFDRLIDINDYSNWLPQSKVFVDCEQTSEGPVELGTKLVDRTRIGVYQGEVSAFERPTNVAFRMRLRWLGMNVMESRPEYHLRSVTEGTEVHMVAEGELFGVFKLMESYVARVAEYERGRTVDALKKTLESSPS